MINLIAAVAENGVIGYEGAIPWDLPEDRHAFRELTYGSTLIMGRRTYESIGRPLDGRKTIVVTSKGIRIPEGAGDIICTAKTLKQAIDLSSSDVYLCGGAAIYEEGIRYADILYITRVELSVKGDTYFPSGFEKDFILTEKKRLGPVCTLMIYGRRP